MKKKRLGLLAILCCGSVALGLSACGGNSPTKGLAYELSEDGSYYTVVGVGTVKETDIVIPSTHNNKPVKAIGEGAFSPDLSIDDFLLITSIIIPDSVALIDSHAFSACYHLVNITIPNSVTFIGAEAFYNCSRLTNIVLPDSVTFIGERAFEACPFTSIVIPDGVTSIENSVFYNCSNLTSIILPDSVTSIGRWAFNRCTGLTSITVGEGNTQYKSIDGNLYSKDGATLIQYALGKIATEFVIPDGVTSIGSSAFSNCTSLTSVTFENPNDWKVDNAQPAASDLSDPATAAEYLKNTYNRWTRTDE